MSADRTALLVEPDPTVRETLTLVLKQAGYTVAECATGEDALAVLRSGHAARIMVTEVRLPGLDGWHLALAVRRLRPSLPILFIPALDNDRSQRVPRSFVLPKPFRPRALTLAMQIMVRPLITYH